ncbi:MAG TPA: hypothetical protein VJT33_07080 [bacterium]|nr:hypothetical protein [bacterium]
MRKWTSMRSWRTWFVLTLISWACVLLVSASTQAVAKEQKPSENHNSSAGGNTQQTPPAPHHSAATGTSPEPKHHNDNTEYAIWPPTRWNTQVVIALVTTAYAVVSYFVLLAIKRQLDIADRHFLADHHGRLAVRYVSIEGSPNEWFVKERPLKCRFTLVNEGLQAITIHSGGYWVCHYRELPMRPFYQRGDGWDAVANNLITTRPEPDHPPDEPFNRLHPGRWTNISVQSTWKIEEPKVFLAEEHLYVVGWFLYHDNIAGHVGPPWDRRPATPPGAPHRMVFCRRYDRRENRFVAVDNPDYEHDAQPD